jgi:hypothetical protein
MEGPYRNAGETRYHGAAKPLPKTANFANWKTIGVIVLFNKRPERERFYQIVLQHDAAAMKNDSPRIRPLTPPAPG